MSVPKDIRPYIFKEFWFWRLPREFGKSFGSLAKVSIEKDFPECKMARIRLRIDCYRDTPAYDAQFQVAYSELFRVPRKAVEQRYEHLAVFQNEWTDDDEWIPPGDFVWYVKCKDGGKILKQCFAIPEMLDWEHTLWPCNFPKRRRHFVA